MEGDMHVYGLVQNAIMKCGFGIWDELWGNIALEGGNTMFPEIVERLTKKWRLFGHGYDIKMIVDRYLRRNEVGKKLYGDVREVLYEQFDKVIQTNLEKVQVIAKLERNDII